MVFVPITAKEFVYVRNSVVEQIRDGHSIFPIELPKFSRALCVCFGKTAQANWCN
jgi:hypothetical protein